MRKEREKWIGERERREGRRARDRHMDRTLIFPSKEREIASTIMKRS